MSYPPYCKSQSVGYTTVQPFIPTLIWSEKMKIEDPKFLSKKQLANLLGLSPYTIDSWVSERKEIPFVKMGRRVMFDLKDVLAWVEANKTYPRII